MGQTQNRSQCSTDASNTKSIDTNLQNETTESQEIVYHEGAYDGRCSSNDKDSTITPISPPSYSHPKRKKLNKTMPKQKRHGPSWSAIAKQADAQTSTAESSPKAKPKATTKSNTMAKVEKINPTKKKTKAKPKQRQEKQQKQKQKKKEQKPKQVKLKSKRFQNHNHRIKKSQS